MSTLLKLTAADYRQMASTGAFDRLDQRIELIHGELREMSPAGPIHSDLINYLNRWSCTMTTVDQSTISIQNGIELLGLTAPDLGDDLDSAPEPDVLWLQPGRYLDRQPTAADVQLLIEVADSSLRYDTGEKRTLYANHRIADYWVVDIPGRQILVHRDPAAGQYQTQTTHGVADEIAPLTNPSAILSIADLFGPLT